MDQVKTASLIVAPDGFLWWKGAKLQARLIPGIGLEFFEKDPRRAVLVGGQTFIVPYQAFLALFVSVRGVVMNTDIIQLENVERKDGEQDV